MWEVLATTKAGRVSWDRVDQLQAAWMRMMAAAAHLRRDGYLTDGRALDQCRGRRAVLDALCTPVLDRAPLLHRRGDDCPCLGDAWIDGYAYRLHAFLKRNPSRAENDRNRAQKADLRDARLKALVLDRDGGCCRYCRSGPLLAKAGRARERRKVLQFDHVDPDRPATPDGGNLVTACARCNEHKGHRTPVEADMSVLPVPTAAEAATWAARGLDLFDLPAAGADQPRTTDEPPTNHRPSSDPTTDAISDPNSDGDADPIDISTGSVRPDPADDGSGTATRWSGKGAGSGRVGHRADGGDPGPPRPPQPTRQPGAADIYHRRSRAPAGPAHPGPLP
ncbi:HNH endonuclease [Micromonospora sp. RV43]|uniref:HNH endonuclease n=1 Tax=Micromonospora sp. RV43 TaxID=1661387 RepID=UPI00137929AD|nr:HNH endonuclease [Micromonospora sp. RV43]